MTNSILSFIKFLFSEIFTLGGLLAALEFIRIVGIFPSIPLPIVIGALALCDVYLLSTGVKIEKWSLSLLTWIPISIVIASPDPLFKSWLRYLNFVLVFIAVSPLLQSPKANEFRKHAFNVFLGLAILFSVASFFGFFLGINMMRVDDADSLDVIQGQAGLFGGFFIQSMVLGPMAAVSAIVCYYKYMLQKEKIFALLGVLSAAACMFAASRAAFGALLVAVVITTYYLAESSSQFRKWSVRWGIILLVTFPVWVGATYLMQQKGNRDLESEGMIYSRMGKYESRIYEIKEKPISGVGFCAMDPRTGDRYDPVSGQIEPGSSWLAVPAQTGLVGLVFFVGLVYRSWKKKSCIRSRERALFLGVLTMFLTHFLAEGYLLSAGGTLSFLAWLTLGVNFRKEDEIKII